MESILQLHTKQIFAAPVAKCCNQALHFRPPVVFARSIVAILHRHKQPVAELIAEPFGEHALHLKVNNALWCAGVNIIIEADQTDVECIQFCFYIELGSLPLSC